MCICTQNNFDQMLTFHHKPFYHFAQEANGIWYTERAIIKLLKYQISLTSCTKLWNNE